MRCSACPSHPIPSHRPPGAAICDLQETRRSVTGAYSRKGRRVLARISGSRVPTVTVSGVGQLALLDVWQSEVRARRLSTIQVEALLGGSERKAWGVPQEVAALAVVKGWAQACQQEVGKLVSAYARELCISRGLREAKGKWVFAEACAGMGAMAGAVKQVVGAQAFRYLFAAEA